MDREKFLAQLLPLIGGRDNASRCEFRQENLYVTLKDASLAEPDAVRKLPGVTSVTEGRSRLTIGFGTSHKSEEVPTMANAKTQTDYTALVQTVVDKIGGKGNIVRATHCITRLRFTLADPSKADKEAIKKIPGVAGCVDKAGQFQVIIGPHVTEVYDALIAYTGLKSEAAVEAEEEAPKKTISSPAWWTPWPASSCP